LINERVKAGSVTQNHQRTFSAFFADDAPNHQHPTYFATELLSVDNPKSFSIEKPLSSASTQV
jgi:hypothetical protein